MAEYLIQERSLVEICDLLRNEFDGYDTLMGLISDRKRLINVDIPDSVTTIGDYAFCYCYSLESVTIGDSVTTIGNFAFMFCTSLVNVNLPSGITIIPNNAFRDCRSLTDIILSKNITNINFRAFQDCKLLTDVYLYATTPPILQEEMAFYGCHSNLKIHVPVGSVETYKTATNWSVYADKIIGDINVDTTE